LRAVTHEKRENFSTISGYNKVYYRPATKVPGALSHAGQAVTINAGRSDEPDVDDGRCLPAFHSYLVSGQDPGKTARHHASSPSPHAPI